MALTKVTEGVRTLGTDEVLTANINDDAVTAAKLAAGAAVPADDSITNVKINSSAAIAQSKLANVGKYTSAATAPAGPADGEPGADPEDVIPADAHAGFAAAPCVFKN